MALSKQLEQHEQHSQFDQATHVSAKLLALDELDESVLQQHIRHLTLAGQKDQALKRFASFTKLLKEELGSEPLAETLDLITQIRNNEIVELKTVKEVKHNLPNQSTHFIGRKTELLELNQHLAKPECRLLSLIGLGGSGKTRLGIELARNQLGNYKDGVYLVELVALETEDAILSSVAQVLEIQLQPGATVKTQILNFLKNKQALFVFDNFEHVLSCASLLNDLLASSDHIKILVTSRESLKLKSEWLFDVGGLETPDLITKNSPQKLNQNEAVKLFISAAKRVMPQLELSSEDLLSIAQIAKQVEGLPLALELAASWVRIMSISRIAKELEQGYTLLETELSDVPERHRNLKTILDKTWESLSENKRETLAKLSVFVGGCTLEAAEQVTGAHFSILLTLVNGSILRRKAERFDFHEVIRQFILAKTLDSPLLSQTKQKHFRYYENLAHDGNQNLNGKEQLLWFTKLKLDYENLLSALEWSLSHLPKDGVGLATNLGRYWEAQGLLKEGEKWLERTLPLSKQSPIEIQAKLHLKYLSMTIIQANHEKATLISSLALELCQKSQNSEIQAEYYNLVGLFKIKQRHFEEAKSLLMQGLSFSKKAQDEVTKSYLFLNLGHLYSILEDIETSTKFQHMCLELAQQRKDLRLEMIVLANMAANKITEKDYEASITFSKQAEVLAEKIDEKRFQAGIKGNLGYAYWQLGNHQIGEMHYREHLILLYEQGVMDNFVENLFELSGFWKYMQFDKQAQILWAIAEDFRLYYSYPTFRGYEAIKQQVLGNLSLTQLKTSLSLYKPALFPALQSGPEKAF